MDNIPSKPNYPALVLAAIAIVAVGATYFVQEARIQALQDQLQAFDSIIDALEDDGGPWSSQPYPESSNPPARDNEPLPRNELYDVQPEFDLEIEPDADEFWEEVEELTIDDLEALADDAERQEFLEDNVYQSFWLPYEWDHGTQQDLFLPHLLDAGFDQIIMTSSCPDHHLEYADYHLGELADTAAAEVLVVDILIFEGFMVDMTVLTDGAILLEYAGWMCGEQILPREELPDDTHTT